MNIQRITTKVMVMQVSAVAAKNSVPARSALHGHHDGGGKLIFHIMGVLAEFERDLIQECTSAGLELVNDPKCGFCPLRGLSGKLTEVVNRLKVRTQMLGRGPLVRTFGPKVEG